MAKIISANIDLTKIDKSKIIEGKNGAKYYNIIIMLNDEKDKYNNDVSIINGQTKEQRVAKEKKVYIGNGKIIWENNSIKTSKEEENNYPDDLPW